MVLIVQDKIDLNVSLSLQLDSLHIYFKHVQLFENTFIL